MSRISLWLGAVRDGFVLLLPLTFLGVAAVLVQHLPWPAYQAWMAGRFGTLWTREVGLVVQASHGVFALALAVAVATQLQRRLPGAPDSREPLSPFVVALSAMMNFMLCVLLQGPMSWERLGHSGMLLGLGVGLATAELLQWLSRHRSLNRALVPYDTDASFFHALRATPLVMVAALLVVGVATLLHLVWPPLGSVLAPVAEWAAGRDSGVYWLTGLAAALNQAVWFVGVHGGHFLDRHAMDWFAARGSFDLHLASRPLLDTFVLMGGTGATLGLLLALLFTVKEGAQRRLAQLSVLPSVFNINETLVYGLPLALNPVYVLPFIGVPVLLALLSQGALQVGLLPPLAVNVPWTTPPLLSGWLATGSWQGAAWQAFEIGLATAGYLPFVRLAEQWRVRRQAAAMQAATEAILTDQPWSTPAVRRQDSAGLIARGLLQDLRQALRRRRLGLAFQPQHDAAGRLVGVEALLRWPHPRHGALSPMVAVMLAEQGGDIHHLGQWVLSEACACKARLNRLGLGPFRMSVNVSPTQLTDPTLPVWLSRQLSLHGLQAEELELEITECQAIQNGSVVDQTLAGLVRLGVRLAMDDFGMGHSSLLHLRRFQVHAIKIDGSLARDVLVDETIADIIRTIATLGRAQRAHVVAEYVESAAQREALERLGCDHFQGHLYSPPLSEGAFAAYLARQGRGRPVVPLRSATASTHHEAA